MKRAANLVLALTLCTSTHLAHGAVKTEAVDYKVGETTLKGLIARDDAIKDRRPGVLVVHEWWGNNDYAKSRASDLAKLGYVAFALDMYGEGKTTTHPDEAGAMAGAIAKDLDTGRKRFLGALELLRSNPHVDPARVAAIGYCFGGGVVLQMAREGVDLKGVVSFHGSLSPFAPGPAKGVRAKILVCTGADDPMAPSDVVRAFADEMRTAGADYEINVYGGAKHSFTNPNAGKAGMDALAYSPSADRRSWAAMRAFFDEIFAK